jgi:hypothetical protein
VLLDGGLEGGRVGADDLADLLAVLEDEESRHGADGVLLGGLGDLVDVDLVEACVGVVVGELDDLRSDDLARTAPGGEEVDDHHARLAEGGIEVGLRGKVVDTGRHVGGVLAGECCVVGDVGCAVGESVCGSGGGDGEGSGE